MIFCVSIALKAFGRRRFQLGTLNSLPSQLFARILGETVSSASTVSAINESKAARRSLAHVDYVQYAMQLCMN